MRLYNIRPSEYLIQNKSAKFVGVGIGSGENLFIVPYHVTPEADEKSWGMTHTTRGFPKIQSGINPEPGWIALLDSFHRGGKAIGVILTAQGDNIELVSARQAEDDQIRWEQALVVIRGEATFYLKRTSPPDLLLEFHETEVIETKVTTEAVEGFLRITDQDIIKWRNKTNAASQEELENQESPKIV